ncbi:outer membrane lipoprotein carrier protein LolA [Pseudomonadota bacterium]
MIGSNRWLYWITLVGYLSLQNAFSDDLTLPLLRQQLRNHGKVSGEFLQCVKQGVSTISGRGRFTVQPGKWINLDYELPKPSTLRFFSDGTESRTVDGIEQESPNYSPLSSLIFSIINLDDSVITSRFEIELRGAENEFDLSLTPKGRLKKRLRSVKVTGTDDMINFIQITTEDNRKISIFLSPPGHFSGISCE